MIIGLTGGIANGKSESAKFFKIFGVCSIDADAISCELTAKNTPILSELVKIFGCNILLPTGILNRQKLASIIFSYKQAKLNVEKILHTNIILRIKEVISQKANSCDIVIDAPLLFEIGLNRICDKTVVVWTSKDIQVKRLALRSNLNIDEIEKRIVSQMPIEKKVKLADFVIENIGSKKDLKKT